MPANGIYHAFKTGMILFAGLILGACATTVSMIALRLRTAAEGYEDETGFHLIETSRPRTFVTPERQTLAHRSRDLPSPLRVSC